MKIKKKIVFETALYFILFHFILFFLLVTIYVFFFTLLIWTLSYFGTFIFTLHPNFRYHQALHYT